MFPTLLVVGAIVVIVALALAGGIKTNRYEFVAPLLRRCIRCSQVQRFDRSGWSAEGLVERAKCSCHRDCC